MTESEEGLIPGIYNYCDRWCERCEFTSRCKTFAMQSEYAVVETDDPMADAMRSVGLAFADAKRMLMEKAEEMGIDLEAAMSDPAIDKGIARQKETVENEDAVKLARSYALETRHILYKSEEWLNGDDPTAAEMLEIVQYYLFSVAVKVHSSYHAVLDIDGFENPEELSDSQSYANGTAKITLIIIERSILAWSYLQNAQNASVIRPIIERLETIKGMLETKLPNAREFVRPGFDEIETVM